MIRQTEIEIRSSPLRFIKIRKTKNRNPQRIIGGVILMAEMIENVGATSSAMERRGIRWVDQKFQWRYAFLLISIVLLVSTVLVGTFWFHSEQVLRTLVAAGVLKQHPLYLLVEQQMHHLLLSVVVVVALFSIFIFVMAFFLSHRIVGPIFAIKRSLEFMANGNFQAAKINLRSDDEFRDVGELVNRVVGSMSSKS